MMGTWRSMWTRLGKGERENIKIYLDNNVSRGKNEWKYCKRKTKDAVYETSDGRH